MIQLLVDTTPCQKFFVGSCLGNPFFCEHKYFFSILDGGKTVGDYEGGAVLCQLLQGILYHFFTLVVQSRGCFIKNQYRRVFEEYSGDRQTLLLSAGQFDAPLSDIGVISIRKSHDKFMGIGIFGGIDNLFSCSAGFPVSDVFVDRAGKEINILLYDPDLTAETLQRYFADIIAVNFYTAAGDIIKPGDQGAESRFSGAGGAYQRYIRAGRHVQTDVVQDTVIILFIMEGNIFKRDISFNCRERDGIFAVPDIRHDIHDLAEPFKTGVSILELLCEVYQSPDRLSKNADIEKEGDEITDVHALKGNQETAHEDDIDLDQCGEETDTCLETAHIVITVFLCREKGIVPLLELVVLDFFIGKRFYNTDAGEIILDLGIDVGDLLAVSFKGAAHFAVEEEGEQEHKWEDDKSCQNEPAVDIHQDDKSACDLQDREDDIFGTMVEQFRDIEKVGGDPAHQLSYLGVIIKRKRELLHMVKNFGAHIVFHLCSHDMSVVADKETAVAVSGK